MEKAINEILGTGIIISPIVIILVEVMKKPNLIPSKWLAPSACFVGILFAVVLSLTYPDLGSWQQLAMSGIVAGAIASGIYTQTNLKNRRRNMKKKIFVGAIIALFLLPINAFAYTINNEFNLGANEGDSRLAYQNYILIHETATLAPARNVAANMKNNYNGIRPYTTDVVGDGGIVYRVGEPGYVSWGALNANPYAPAQIELQHTYDRNLFEKNYRAYVELIRDYCNQFNIPKTLDTPYPNKGVKSHLWVTNTYGGDHTDPYGYLSEMGVSKEKLAYDLAHGFTDENPTTSENKPVIDPTRAGAANPTLTDGTNYAHIDQFGEIENANLHVAGWHIANYKYEYIFIMDYNTGKELARVRADGIYRPDVNQAYNTSGNVGYHVSFNMRNFPNKKVYVMMRATNDPKGNTKGGAQDFHDKRWYLNIPQR